MESISRRLRSYQHVLMGDDCNNGNSPCHIMSSISGGRALEEVVDIVVQPPATEEESGVSSFLVIMIALCVIFAMGIAFMFYCAFQKNSDYDEQQARQTRRYQGRRHQSNRPNHHNHAANNNETPPPPDPERPQKIAVNLYYGTVSPENVGSEMGMKKMSSGRFMKKKATAFEPRQPRPDDECPICCDNFLPGEDYVISKVCNHVYHKRCIEQWTITEQKDDCPVCRRSLLPSSSDLPPPILP